MALVITGAGGFLGRTLIDRCKGKKIVAVSEQEMSKYTGVTVVRREDFFKHYRFTEEDRLVNCAFPMNGPDASRLASGLNFIGRVMGKAADEGVGGVVNISSQSVYSQKRTTPADELTEVQPESAYALGKYTSEIITNNLCRRIPHTNIRLASLIGPGYDIRIVNRLVKKVFKGEMLTVSICPRKFEFLDVRDAADAILGLADYKAEDWRETYVLGGHCSYSLEEIVDIIQEVYKRYCPQGFQVKKANGDDCANNSLDSRLLYDLLGWKPRYELKDSVETIMEYEWSMLK